MKIEKSILKIIEQGITDGNLYYLPKIKLDRKIYLAANKVLENLGGKWIRKQKAHVFESDISDRIDNVLLTGEVVDPKKEFQFFETPPELAKQLVGMAEIQWGESILEPSAGRGAILWHICYELRNKNGFVDCVELYQKNREFLTAKLQEYNLVGDDFLQFHEKYDVIIANPPFTKQQDIDHVSHMIDLANRVVVSVMGAGVKFRQNKKTMTFWDKVKQYDYEMIDLPAGAFKKSGTMVSTIILKVTKEQ